MEAERAELSARTLSTQRERAALGYLKAELEAAAWAQSVTQVMRASPNQVDEAQQFTPTFDAWNATRRKLSPSSSASTGPSAHYAASLQSLRIESPPHFHRAPEVGAHAYRPVGGSPSEPLSPVQGPVEKRRSAPLSPKDERAIPLQSNLRRQRPWWDSGRTAWAPSKSPPLEQPAAAPEFVPPIFHRVLSKPAGASIRDPASVRARAKAYNDRCRSGERKDTAGASVAAGSDRSGLVSGVQKASALAKPKPKVVFTAESAQRLYSQYFVTRAKLNEARRRYFILCRSCFSPITYKYSKHATY